MHTRIVGLDPGNENTGMIVLDDELIVGAYNLPNTALFDKIAGFTLHKSLCIVIEDMKPFSLRLSPQVINTCKFIGELVFRLRVRSGLNVVLLSRFEVQKWIFDSYNSISQPLIVEKIDKKLYEACDITTKELVRLDNNSRKARKPSFHYVDDKIVTAVMKRMYQIPTPAPGKGFMYGLQTHSWQALAVASRYIYMTKQAPL